MDARSYVSVKLLNGPLLMFKFGEAVPLALFRTTSLSSRGVSAVSKLYEIADDGLWPTLKRDAASAAAFLSSEPAPAVVDDDTPLTAGMRLLAVPADLSGVSGTRWMLLRSCGHTRCRSSTAGSLLPRLVALVLQHMPSVARAQQALLVSSNTWDSHGVLSRMLRCLPLAFLLEMPRSLLPTFHGCSCRSSLVWSICQRFLLDDFVLSHLQITSGGTSDCCRICCANH